MNDQAYIDKAKKLAQFFSSKEVKSKTYFNFMGREFELPDDLGPLNLAVSVATAAVASHAEVGDLYWHNGSSAFSWPDKNGHPVEMDAETLIDFAKEAHNAS